MTDLWLDKVTYEFSQEGNTDGTTRTDGYDDLEVITIEIQSICNSLVKEPVYLVLRTPTGWSFNSVEELDEIFNIVKKGIGKE